MLYPVILILLAIPNLSVRAQEKAVELQRDSSISHVLKDDLKLWPIYGKQGPLKKTLELNNLNLNKARKLPIGFKVKIPDELMPLPPAPVEKPEESVALEIPEVKTEVIKPETSFGLNSGLYQYSGQSSSKGSFKSLGPYIGLAHKRDWLRLRLDLFHIPRPGNEENVLNLCSRFFMNKELETGTLSAGAGLKRNFFLLGKNVSEDIKYAFIPELVSLFNMDYHNFNLEFELGLNLPSVGDLKSKTSPFGGFMVSKGIYKEWNLGTGIHLEKRAVEKSNQTFSRLEISARKSF